MGKLTMISKADVRDLYNSKSHLCLEGSSPLLTPFTHECIGTHPCTLKLLEASRETNSCSIEAAQIFSCMSLKQLQSLIIQYFRLNQGLEIFCKRVDCALLLSVKILTASIDFFAKKWRFLLIATSIVH